VEAYVLPGKIASLSGNIVTTPPAWDIILDFQEQRRKVALWEGRARRPDTDDAEDAVEFSLTLYPDQISLNVPASTPGRAFIAELTAILGPPRLEPTVKCSCSWGQGVMGAMLIVLWDLPTETSLQKLAELRHFLGN
jgi:hypothetical protein